MSQKTNKYHFLNKKHLILFVFSSFLFTTLLTKAVYADTLKSDSYYIFGSNINMTGGQKSSEGFILTDTVGQTFQGQFSSSGYVIQAGFQYLIGNRPFVFTISDLNIDLGVLVPNIPTTRTNTLTVDTGSARGYTIKVVENHPLRLISGTSTIPDTSCDSTLPCSIADATEWNDNGRFGFGYNIQGIDVDTVDFEDDTFFRPFAIGGTDVPATIMESSSVGTASATMTYKALIGSTQPAGDYQNEISFLAMPSL